MLALNIIVQVTQFPTHQLVRDILKLQHLLSVENLKEGSRTEGKYIYSLKPGISTVPNMFFRLEHLLETEPTVLLLTTITATVVLIKRILPEESVIASLLFINEGLFGKTIYFSQRQLKTWIPNRSNYTWALSLRILCGLSLGGVLPSLRKNSS